MAWIRWIDRENLEAAAAVHVTSAREAEDALRFDFRWPLIEVVPNGVALPRTPDVRVPSPRIRELVSRENLVLYLGRINWKKGLDRLISAMALLPEAHLAVAGSDENGLEGRLRQQAERLEIVDRVTFTGTVFGRDKAALLRSASVLVLPSHSENFGNVVLEALASSCPVVVTPEVGAAAIVREANAGFVVPGVPGRLAESIRELVEHPGRRREMGLRGRALVRREYSWARVAERMIALYRAALTSRRRMP
jgi:glycosyltransferase involved in cell wall biosynthesis